MSTYIRRYEATEREQTKRIACSRIFVLSCGIALPLLANNTYVHEMSTDLKRHEQTSLRQVPSLAPDTPRVNFRPQIVV